MAGLSSGRPGRSQFSHGKSRAPNPRSNFQGVQNLPWEQGEDENDVLIKRMAELRSDPTNGLEDLEQMPYVLGNPDMYGPDEAIIQEPAVKPAGRYPQPPFRTGVTRQS